MNTFDEKIKKMLGKNKLGNNMKFSTIFNKKLSNNIFNFKSKNFMKNIIGISPIKGASIKMQMQWKNMSPTLKGINRILYKDIDKDSVPDRWDCRPFNKLKHNNLARMDIFNQIKAVERGEKPIAEIDESVEKELGIKTTLPFIRDCTNSGYNNKVICSKIYYGPGNKEIALELKDLTNNTPLEKKKHSLEYHQKLGELYGYNQDEINEFLEKIKYFNRTGEYIPFDQTINKGGE